MVISESHGHLHMSGIVGIEAIFRIKLWLKQVGYPATKPPDAHTVDI